MQHSYSHISANKDGFLKSIRSRPACFYRDDLQLSYGDSPALKWGYISPALLFSLLNHEF